MLSYSTQLIDEDDIAAVVEVLRGDFLAQGPKVAAFEDDLCAYTGAKYAVAFNSATSALFSAYTVLDIHDEDEVITTPISFVATSNMFVALGAKPVWCDVKRDGNIDESKIEQLITSKTKAIVAVDFAGKPVKINAINAIAKRHGLKVVQDSSHSLGASINNKKIGTFADMSVFSFHAIKPITTSEGGAVLTDDEEYAKKLKLFRSHGMEKKELWESDMRVLGHNFRMTEVAGALGSSQLKKLNSFIEKRKVLADYFDERFQDETLFDTCKIDATELSSYHLYPILLNPALHPLKKSIFEELQKRGLGVQVHYRPIYQNSFYKEKFGIIQLQEAENFYSSEISIPCNQTMSLKDAEFVAQTLLDVLSIYQEKSETP